MFKTLWHGWLRVARVIGAFQSRIVLTLVYFVVLAPFALAVRFGTDPLGQRQRGGWRWLPAAGGDVSIDAVRRQS